MIETAASQKFIDAGDSSAHEGTRYTLENGKRLSQSILWKLQHRFFEQNGIGAWRDGVVPHYITSNPFIAKAYAGVISGYLQDCRRAFGDDAHTPNDPIDPGQPFYIIELGCGSGRFSYHFLKKFQEIHRRSGFGDIRFQYIMTDTGKQNVEFWRSHDSFKEFTEAGILDFALFDPRHAKKLELILCGQSLSEKVVRNPMVFIANYFFDSIPMDAFYIKEGRLYESLVSVHSSREEPDPTDPEILSRMTVSYEHEPAEAAYYADAEWNRILEHYAQCLVDTAVTFPVGAMECMRNISRISKGRMIILSADRGESREGALQERKISGISVHGSFSLRVNYDAIGRYIVNQGGSVFHPNHRHSSLNVSAFVQGDQPGRLRETRRAYEEYIDAFGPDDFYLLKKGMQEVCDHFTIEQILAFLRLSGWDANILIICYSTLMRQLDDAKNSQILEICSAIRHVWDTYYPIGEKTDVAFHLGTLLCRMRCYKEALDFFQHSIRHYGQSPGTEYNMAICLEGLGNMAGAKKCIKKALELDPNFEPAREMHIEMESKRR